MGVMTMRNIAPKVTIKCTLLLIWASMLIITPSRLPDATTLPMPTYLNGSLSEKSVQIITLPLHYEALSYKTIFVEHDKIGCRQFGQITLP